MYLYIVELYLWNCFKGDIFWLCMGNSCGVGGGGGCGNGVGWVVVGLSIVVNKFLIFFFLSFEIRLLR